MKKLFTLFILLSLNVVAQSWCAPGALWHFYWYNFGNAPGHVKYTYTGTVTINNKVCQKIDAFKVAMLTNLISTYSISYSEYTYTENNVVYLTNATGSSFDTLYNFNANVGDKWSLTPKNYTCCAESRVNVVATGTQVIDGVTLKWLKVSINGFSGYSNSATGPFNDTIIERIGALKYSLFETFPLCPHVSDGVLEKSLRCYRDNQIADYKKTTGVCDYLYTSTTGNAEIELTNKISVYPNPANTEIFVKAEEFDATPCLVRITNLLGQVAYKTTINPKKGEFSIDLNSLPKGIYQLEIITSNKRIFAQKLVKD